LEKKRFCGPSEEEREREREWFDLLEEQSKTGWVGIERRCEPREIPWGRYIAHLQAEHGASFSFEVDSHKNNLFKRKDGIIGGGRINKPRKHMNNNFC